MRFDSPLVRATLVRRYKRFLADVVLDDGHVTTVHCPNTGTMESCYTEGATVYLTQHSSDKRKYPLTWELTECPDGFIGINTHRTNAVVEAALRTHRIAELSTYSSYKREVSTGDSRVDFLLEDSQSKKKMWLEVKNVTLRKDDWLLFPDTVSVRAQKHIHELIRLRQAGDEACLFFCINRPDGARFRAAEAIDPAYHHLLKNAHEAGVLILAYRAQADLAGISLAESVPIDL